MFGALLEVELRKSCATPARGAIWKSKSLKTGRFGALLEAAAAKIAPDFEANIAKN